jgi:uncharacterized protein (DUF2141 family)
MKSNIYLLLISIFIFSTSCNKDEVKPDGIDFQTSELVLDGNGSEESMVEYIEVTVTNIKNVKGIMSFALYNNNSSFNDPEQAFLEYFIPVTDKPSMTFRFDNIPPGEYALALFHDENSNNELDQNFLRIPQEGFGFSNNAMGNFGPPKYEDAKFLLKAGNFVKLTVNLTHY